MPRDPGGKGRPKVGDEVGGNGAGGPETAQNGDVVLLCHFQTLGVRRQIPGKNQCGGLIGEKSVKNNGALRGGEPFNKADLHIAHQLEPHGLKMVKIPGKLKPGPCHILHGNADFFVIRGQKGRFQMKFLYQFGKGNTVGFCHPGTSLRQACYGIYYNNIRLDINPKIKNQFFLKKGLAF